MMEAMEFFVRPSYREASPQAYTPAGFDNSILQAQMMCPDLNAHVCWTGDWDD